MQIELSDNPLISVIIPVYNVESYVSEAIESILAQTYPKLELIIVDDGSTDDSAGIIRRWAQIDHRILPVFLQHCGRSLARNKGIVKAKGEYIAFLDADDVALAERLDVQLKWMQRNGVEICGSCVKLFGEESGIYWFPETHEAILKEFLFHLALLLPSVTMQAQIAKSHLFKENSAFEDYEYLTRLASLYRMGNMPQVLIKHRRHAKQSHVVEAEDFGNDFRKYSLAYFHTLFPEASTSDHTIITHIIEKKPLQNLQDLELAGLWMMRLAQTTDNFLRRRMAERWQAACQRSAHLGSGCYRLYRRILPRFGVTENKNGMFKLQLACTLRMRPDSRLHKIFGGLKRVWTKRRKFTKKSSY